MSEERIRPIIGVMLHEGVPANFEDAFADSVGTHDLAVGIRRHPGGPYAGVELYLPAAVMVFVAKGYFDGFLQKLGEDHYDTLKAAAKHLWRKAGELKFSIAGSTGTVAASRKFSMLYAIVGEVEAGLSFKLVLKSEIEPSSAEQGIAAFLDLIRNLHTGSLSDEDQQALLRHHAVGGTVLVTFDADAKRIVPVTVAKRKA